MKTISVYGDRNFHLITLSPLRNSSRVYEMSVMFETLYSDYL